LDQQLSAALPARNPGQLKIAETALRGPLVIEPELQDPAPWRTGSLPMAATSCSPSGRWTCSPTRAIAECSS